MSNSEGANPGVFPLLLFGYSLAVLGVRFLITPEATGALVFSVLVAAIAQTIGGLWLISQGQNYLGSIIATFGIWLIGLFMLETLGHVLGLASPQTMATYFLVLLVPIALLAVPAVNNAMPWPIRAAFLTLFLLVLAAGLNFVFASRGLGLAAGVFAWLAAACIWKLAAGGIRALGATEAR